MKLRRMDDRTTGGLLVPTGDAEKPKEGYVRRAWSWDAVERRFWRSPLRLREYRRAVLFHMRICFFFFKRVPVFAPG